MQGCTPAALEPWLRSPDRGLLVEQLSELSAGVSLVHGGLQCAAAVFFFGSTGGLSPAAAASRGEKDPEKASEGSAFV